MCHHRGNYGCFKLIAETVFENNVIFGACYSVLKPVVFHRGFEL